MLTFLFDFDVVWVAYIHYKYYIPDKFISVNYFWYFTLRLIIF